MKPEWNNIRKQLSGFIIFYCAIFTSVILIDVINSGNTTVIISRGNLIGPAIGGLIYIIFSQIKKAPKPGSITE